MARERLRKKEVSVKTGVAGEVERQEWWEVEQHEWLVAGQQGWRVGEPREWWGAEARNENTAQCIMFYFEK
ncbi:hypothetical protein WN943_000931 [Citrus x changshan-huyou]